MPNWLLTVLLALLSVGFGTSVLAMLRGADLWRGRTAKTEAQGIAFLERNTREADYARQVAVHRLEHYRDEVNPYLRNRIGDLEYVIRTTPGLGREAIPSWEPAPVMKPLPPRPAELTRGDDDRDDTPAAVDG